VRQVDDCGAVDLHHFDLSSAIGGGELAVSAEAGIVDEQIDVKIFLADESEDRVRGGWIGEIGDADFGADVVFGGEIARQRRQTILASCRQYKIRAGCGEFGGERNANSGAGARDERPLPYPWIPLLNLLCGARSD
jgi:hypothetical protein